MSPDALSGPGRALQGLGRAISGLAGDFAAAADAPPSPDDQFKANLELVKFSNDQDVAEATRQSTFQGDPEGYAAGSVEEFDTQRQELLSRLPQHPKIQQGATLHTERMRGSRMTRAHGFEANQKHGQLIARIDETATQEVGTAQPGNIPEITTKLRGVDAIIESAPGLSPAEKAALRDKMSAAALSRILETVPDEDKLGVTDKLIQEWTSELSVPEAQQGQEPQAGQAGSQSGPALNAPGGQAAPASPEGFKPDLGKQSSLTVDPAEFRDFSKGRGGKPLQKVENIILHDVSGNPANRRLPKGGNIPNYHITFDKDGVYLESPLGRRAPHAAAFNANSIGIAHIGFEGDTLDPKAIENGAKAVKFVMDRTGVTADKILTHPGAGPSATRRGGKDPREASWRTAVLERIGQGVDTSKMALGAPGSGSETQGLKVEATAYSPQKAGSKMEGGYAAARPGPDGKAEVRTLADVAAGRSQYVTVAGDKAQFGKSYTIPEISFVDKDGKTQTLKNVKAVVHDTGSAFKGAKEGRFDIAIDRDASDKHMAASHALWKKAGLQFVPEGQVTAEPAPQPVNQRGFTQYAGLTNPEPPKGIQVADASGAIPQSAKIGQDTGQDRTGTGQRAENTIPGAGQDPAMPKWRTPSVRGSVVEKLLKMRPALIDAQKRALGAMVDGAEKSAADGYHLPDEQRIKLREKITASGDTQLIQRLDAAEAAAEYTQTLRMGNLQQVKQQAVLLREELNQGGGTPDQIARVKAVEGLAANMEKKLSDDSIGWAVESGAMPPVEPVTPDNFSVDALMQRKAVADQIGETYGMEYRQFFRNGEERAQIEAEFTRGGESMVNMLATMYEAFGGDTPKAVAEIAPKNPEAVRAAFLAATGGDPKAVKDVAETILRRKEEGYQGAPTFDKTQLQADFDAVVGDLHKGERARRDEIMATAKAIYENRVEDPAVYNADQFRESIQAALGTRKGPGGLEYGGPMSQNNTDWESPYVGGNTVLIPSNIRKDMWNVVLDAIDDKDLVAAGHPLPADHTGKPIPIARALAYGTFQQVGPGKYAIVRMATKDGERGGLLMTAAPPRVNPDEISTADIAASVQQGGGDIFVLDLETLTPTLRARLPSAFWKE